MKGSSSLLLFAALVQGGLGFIGLPKPMYQPYCAFACRATIESNPLDCSYHGMSSGMHMGHSSGLVTTPACRADDTYFLTTLAYCMNSTCTPLNVEPWKLEKFWEEKATPSTGEVSVTPKWTYAETLEQISSPPSRKLKDSETVLEFTALYDHASYVSQKGTLKAFEDAETHHSIYGLILLVVGFGTPIVFTFFQMLPGGSAIADRLKPYLVRSTFGKTHVQSLHPLLGNMPLVGHTLYIVMFTILNVVLAAVGYRSFQPNTWFSNTWQETMGYVSCRTGVLAFALAPLVFLFSGRNNFLLWITNWSHSTYMLLHRWIARIFTLQVVAHSLVELILYQDYEMLEMEQSAPYWIWGIVGTVACCIMVVISQLPFRRWSYEIFLISHIILALLVLVGSWYHVELLFEKRWAYEWWLYMCFAIWGFDRVLRIVRILRVGARSSKMTEIGPNIVRIDVEGVRWNATPGHHAYAYFPTLNPLKPWENHPFSVIPTAMLSERASRASDTSSNEGDIEKVGQRVEVSSVSSQNVTTTSGITLFVRKSTGMTKGLRKYDGTLTLMDGPYTNNSPASVLECDRLLLIGGGIGITGLLPFLRHHINVKLFWSLKQENETLVQELEGPLSLAPEKELRLGQRFDFNEIVARETEAGWKRIGVVVCGPASLCDDVRAVVTQAGRSGKGTFELEVDAFSW